ncbi:MAG: hypothetical protein P8075_09800 [Deltaproteobacteria bacterium]|jgi:hypothetical protein
MAKTSSRKNPKDGKAQQVATNKLEFLLDTIDTEVANLADVVNVEGPILDDKTPGGAGGAVSLSDGGVGLESLELDMDFYKETEKPPAEEESVDKGAQAALEAMSDAEGEVEAILSKEGTADGHKVGSPSAPKREEVDADLAKALDELLATREVDASKLLQKTQKPKIRQSKEVQSQKVQTVEDRLPEDIFDDLDKDLELVLEGAAAENPEATDGELEADLLGDVEMDFVEKPDGEAAEEAAIEAGISKDLFETSEQNIAVEEKVEKGSAAVNPASSSDTELADFLSKKIEGLVTRLVEERLSEIAERVIMEKINKIFKSMK